MSIRVQIGTSERDISVIEPNWVNEQIDRRKIDGAPICVRVSIKQEDINISLATNDCPKDGGGGGRLPNKREKKYLTFGINYTLIRNPSLSGI